MEPRLNQGKIIVASANNDNQAQLCYYLKESWKEEPFKKLRPEPNSESSNVFKNTKFLFLHHCKILDVGAGLNIKREQVWGQGPITKCLLKGTFLNPFPNHASSIFFSQLL